MPRRANIRRRRPGRKVKRVRKARVGRSLRTFNDAGQIARIKETVQFTDINPGLGYNFAFNLSQFRRASALAPSFKWYKATYVEWTIEPLYNVFQDGTTGAEVTMPYMFTTMNRTQDTSNLSLADLKAMGAKPQKLTSKKVIKYRPNWCSPGLTQIARFENESSPTGYIVTETTSAGLKAQYSMLASPLTNPGNNNPDFMVPEIAPLASGPPGGLSIVQSAIQTNQVVYNGHVLWVDQGVPTGVLQPCAKVTCTVHWFFKDPHCTYLSDPSKNVMAKPI